MNENQTTYPTGAQDEEEIDLVALMVTLRQKIRLLMKRLWLSISRKRRIMSLLCSSTS